MNKALSIDPDLAAALNDRGVLKHLRDDLSGAMDDYDSAIRKKPDFAKALMNRGILCLEMDLHAQAERDFAEAIRVDSRMKDLLTRFQKRN